MPWYQMVSLEVPGVSFWHTRSARSAMVLSVLLFATCFTAWAWWPSGTPDKDNEHKPHRNHIKEHTPYYNHINAVQIDNFTLWDRSFYPWTHVFARQSKHASIRKSVQSVDVSLTALPECDLARRERECLSAKAMDGTPSPANVGKGTSRRSFCEEQAELLRLSRRMVLHSNPPSLRTLHSVVISSKKGQEAACRTARGVCRAGLWPISQLSTGWTAATVKECSKLVSEVYASALDANALLDGGDPYPVDGIPTYLAYHIADNMALIMAAVQLLAANGYAVIAMENDLDILPQDEVMALLSAALPELPDDWDLLYLGGCFDFHTGSIWETARRDCLDRRPVSTLQPGKGVSVCCPEHLPTFLQVNKHIFPTKCSRCFNNVMISNRGARKLVRMMPLFHYWMPLDLGLVVGPDCKRSVDGDELEYQHLGANCETINGLRQFWLEPWLSREASKVNTSLHGRFACSSQNTCGC